jgi:hypothetical protein
MREGVEEVVEPLAMLVAGEIQRLPRTRALGWSANESHRAAGGELHGTARLAKRGRTSEGRQARSKYNLGESK